MRVDRDPLRRRGRAALVVGLISLAAGSIPISGAVSADPSGGDGGLIERLSRAVTAASFEVVRTDAAKIDIRDSDRMSRPATPARALDRQLFGADDGEPAAAVPVEPPSVREQIAAGCPALDDPELLRDAAAADGHGLCIRSVHEARSDHSAAAIVEGFGLLGLPYSRGRRGQDGYDDCSSFVGRSYRDAGFALSASDWEPSSWGMRDAPWAVVVDAPLPGDILWRSGHVAMALADGYQMHTSQYGDVSHVRAIGRYSKALAVNL